MEEKSTEILELEQKTVQLCSFWLSDRLFGVNITDVKEINNNIILTPIYHAPEAVSGYMNIRGQIHLVLNLCTLFGFEKRDITEESKVIIFKQNVDEAFGILVDRIDDIVSIHSDTIEERRTGEKTGESGNEKNRRKASSELTEGICKLDKGLLVLLNAYKLLPALPDKNST